MVTTLEVKLEPDGHVLIPAEFRQAMGIEPGAVLLVRVEEDRLVLVPRDTIVQQLRAMFTDVKGSMADELIAERHAAAAAAARDVDVP